MLKEDNNNSTRPPSLKKKSCFYGHCSSSINIDWRKADDAATSSWQINLG